VCVTHTHTEIVFFYLKFFPFVLFSLRSRSLALSRSVVLVLSLSGRQQTFFCLFVALPSKIWLPEKIAHTHTHTHTHQSTTRCRTTTAAAHTVRCDWCIARSPGFCVFLGGGLLLFVCLFSVHATLTVDESFGTMRAQGFLFFFSAHAHASDLLSSLRCLHFNCSLAHIEYPQCNHMFTTGSRWFARLSRRRLF
jgi:hypothetical protein